MKDMYVRKLSITFAAVLMASVSQSWSQATLDRLLATVNINGSASCSTVDIRFNRAANVLSASRFSASTDVTLRLEPLATTTPGEDTNSLKEAASVAPGNAANLSSVSFDPFNASGPVIHLIFNKAMAVKLTRDNDSTHVLLSVSPAANEKSCFGGKADLSPVPKTDGTAKGDVPPVAAGGDAASALAEGKKLLNAGDFNRATAFFTKAVGIGTGRVKQDAQEMLGLSHERANQMAFAKSEYETYLKAYPNGADAARVKDRLNGVIAAMENTADEQFQSRKAKLDGAQNPAPLAQLKSDKNGVDQKTAEGSSAQGGLQPISGLSLTQQGMKTNLHEPAVDPKAWVWQKNGSLSQYYYRDDNFVPSSSAGVSSHRVYQNEILSSGDFYLRGDNEDYTAEMRLSTYYEKGLGEQAYIDSKNLSTIYVDGRMKKTGMGLRVGRQSKSTGGVFGRFDGAVGTYEPIKDLKIQAVGGSPVYSRDASLFADNRYFYGASVEYTLPSREWAGSTYFIQQNISDIVDRRAVGAELRYLGKKLNGYSAADYDIYYSQLNNAYVSATWLPRDGTSIYGTADYRRVPFLLTSNALMGQNYSKLTTLVDDMGIDTVNQWATDRTASSETLTLGGTQNITKDWQIALDATIANYSGTPASGGVDGTPAPGLEYYGSVQLTGMNLWKENDSATFGLRYSGSQASNMYMADATFRIPINDDLRLGPRIRSSMTISKIADQQTYLLMPSLTARYRISKQWSLEGELGARWQDTVTPIGSNINVDVLATIGYRFEF